LTEKAGLVDILTKNEETILKNWVVEQLVGGSRQGAESEGEIKEASRAFLSLFAVAVKSDYSDKLGAPEWGAVRAHLHALSRERVLKGFSPAETAPFIFSPMSRREAAERREDFDEALVSCKTLLTRARMRSTPEEDKRSTGTLL
jgi:RsbT co-antagonist protein rsbRD N-terminal domain